MLPPHTSFNRTPDSSFWSLFALGYSPRMSPEQISDARLFLFQSIFSPASDEFIVCLSILRLFLYKNV
jgi:hypothetical protein